ncbi:guanine nucleotide-binding protein subunit alpha-13-like [Patiria miniata]|uniref:Uncharacterized protein n=1 Tax=Patiria miniata TaxID=46514 RepID=A0A913Z6G3_PATMI|nr:guanine nucleotide-binding protein subunit alpha-13-like [Patiria miniata]
MAANIFSCCVPIRQYRQREQARRAATARSEAIDKELAGTRTDLKVLLLGSPGSGKSTFIKQLRSTCIDGDEFTNEEVERYRDIIYSNVIEGLKSLLDARSKLQIPWDDAANEEHAARVIDCDTSQLNPRTFATHVSSCKALWADNGIQEAYKRRDEFQLESCVGYFLDELDRIGNEDYHPYIQDILYAQQSTPGVAEYVSESRDLVRRFIDLGALLRYKKVFTHFEDVRAVLYFVSVDEFDQVLTAGTNDEGTGSTNWLMKECDALSLILKCRWFTGSQVFLILNKADLLEQKIKHVNLKDFFPQFDRDPRNIDQVKEFIFDLFEKRCDSRWGDAFCTYFITAVDQINMASVWSAMSDAIRPLPKGSPFVLY